MENEQTSAIPEQAHPLFKVTTLSKYLAMILFIIMPFVGGWIGYMYAPEKVVEVERVIERESSAENGEVNLTQNETMEQPLPLYSGIETEVRPGSTHFNTLNKNIAEYLNISSNLEGPAQVFTVTQISSSIMHVTAHLSMGDLGDIRSFLMQSSDFTILKEVTGGPEYVYSITEWIQGPNNTAYEIAIEHGDRYASRVSLYDYVNQKMEVLYEESDPSVQLASSCELGCRGFIYWTGVMDNSVLVGRFKRTDISSPANTEFVEAIEIEFPEQYKYIVR